MENDKNKVNSVLYLEDKIDNGQKKSQNECDHYYPVFIVETDKEGNIETVPALFTKNAITRAIKRAESNPEDVEQLEDNHNSMFDLWCKLTNENVKLVGKIYDLEQRVKPWWKKLFNIG